MAASTISPADEDAVIFRSSRTPIVVGIVILSTILIAPILVTPRPAPMTFLLLGALVGPLIALAMIRLIHPVNLVANSSGFILEGAFVRSCGIQRWDDVERIFLKSTTSGDRIACELTSSSLRRFPAYNDASDTATILSGFRPADPGRVVSKLNALREQALGHLRATSIRQSEGSVEPTPSGPPIQSETIQASRSIYLSAVALLLIPIALMGCLEIATKQLNLVAPALWAIIAAPFISRSLWLAVKLPCLVLDAHGITVPGGIARKPRVLSWNDLQEFIVYRAGTAGLKSLQLRIAYFLRPEAQPKFILFRLSTWTAQQIIPSFYTNNAHAIVGELNNYRRRALGIAG